MEKLKKQVFAFTLAEVLITLAIIGVVAAMTIPTLMNKTNDKELATAKTTMNAKIVEAMSQMQAKEELTGYTTSEEFAEAFKKYMKITNVCDSTKLSECFGHDSIGGEGNSVNITKYATSANMVADATGYPTNSVGIQFANGTTCPATGSCIGTTYNTILADSIGLPDTYSGDFGIWSSALYNASGTSYASYRIFNSRKSKLFNSFRDNNAIGVVCKGD